MSSELDHVADLAAFVEASPSSHHAAAEGARRLAAEGFASQEEAAEWSSEPGGHYVVRDGALIAWRIPQTSRSFMPFRILGSHTDSTGFALKPRPDLIGYGGQRREGRITEIDGFHLEARPEGHLLVMRNRDVPGVIGKVGTILGEGGVNISRFHLGRRERGGEAMAVIEVDAPLSRDTLQSLRALEQVISAQPIEL